jgi:DHA3 family tetracycline resistance protein-like MFS transporter
VTKRRFDPANIFVRGFGAVEGIEWGFWLALTVFWVVELGLGPLELVLLGIVLEASVLVAETPTGVVADLHSRKRSIVISHVLMGISFIWSVASLNYWLILPAQALVGVGWTFRSGADTAWVTDELKGRGEFDDDDIDRLLLRKHRFGILVGFVAVALTMAVGSLTSVRWVAGSMGVLYIGVGFVLYSVMNEEYFVSGKDAGRGFVDTFKEGLSAVANRPRLRVLVVVILFVDMGSEAFDRLGYKHFLDNVGSGDSGASEGSLVVLGVLFLALALAGLAANAASSRMLEKGHGVVRLAVALLLIAAVGGFIAAVTNMMIVIAIGFMLQDGVREALWPTMEGWANRDAPSEVRATVHSLMGQMTSIGELIGGVSLGLLAEFASIQVSLVVGAVFFGAAGLTATKAIAPKNQPALD